MHTNILAIHTKNTRLLGENPCGQIKSLIQQKTLSRQTYKTQSIQQHIIPPQKFLRDGQFQIQQIPRILTFHAKLLKTNSASERSPHIVPGVSANHQVQLMGGNIASQHYWILYLFLSNAPTSFVFKDGNFHSRNRSSPRGHTCLSPSQRNILF